MPRTAVPVVSLTRDGLATPGTTAVDPTNGHELVYVKGANLFLEVNNTATAAKDVTLKRGDSVLAPGQRSDLALTVPGSSRRFLGPFDVGAWAQAGQKINVDLAAGITGTIAAYTV
jgi:hypothetical protein